jgi:uncharacterized protein (TIGR02265 family)
MGYVSRAIELVAPHCDIVERIELVPPSAAVRGIYFQDIETQVERAGAIGRYRTYFPDDKFSSLPYYPLKEYLPRIACGGALIKTPADVHAGMFAITRGNAETFAKSLFGRALFRILARDLVPLIEQGVAVRRQTMNYGRWTIVRRGPRELEVVYEDEYAWIESIIAGAAQGTVEARGIQATLETRLTSRFNGSTLFRW